jgi:flagellar basal body-associated protein FliL
MLYVRKNLIIIVIVLLSVLAIALVLWIYEKRLKSIEAKGENHRQHPTKERPLPEPLACYFTIG